MRRERGESAVVRSALSRHPPPTHVLRQRSQQRQRHLPVPRVRAGAAPPQELQQPRPLPSRHRVARHHAHQVAQRAAHGVVRLGHQPLQQHGLHVGAVLGGQGAKGQEGRGRVCWASEAMVDGGSGKTGGEEVRAAQQLRGTWELRVRTVWLVVVLVVAVARGGH